MEVIYNSKLQIIADVKQSEGNGESSEYLERFRENIIKAVEKDAWKYGGQGAQFQGSYKGRGSRDTECQLKINSIAAFDSKDYIYSATASGQGDTVSAIL